MRSNFKRILADKLGESIDASLVKHLPTGYQQVGRVVILNLSEEITHKKLLIAEAVQSIVKNCETVCLKKGEIVGQFREPQLELVLGTETETVVVENSIKYKFDVLKIMFAKGNVNERKRYIKLIKKDEVVFDFFAGIGYFSLGIAKFSLAKKVYAIELNPVSYRYLVENRDLNKIAENRLIPVFGDCRVKALEIQEQADRILMGILPSPKAGLDTAFKKINDRFAVIHYEGILSKDDKPETLLADVTETARRYHRQASLVHVEKIKSYRPHVYHVCLDIEIR